MKKLLLTISLISCFSLFSDSFNLDFGLSLGNISFIAKEDYGIVAVDLFSLRVLETESGFGVTTYIWPNINLDIDAPEFEQIGNDLFALEFNYEPLFRYSSWYGLGYFFRIDNFFPGGNEFYWRTGLRFDVRTRILDCIYPLGALEGGYVDGTGFYASLSLDPVLFLMIVLD